MPGEPKSVRFADETDTYSYPSTPSPTYSTSTLPSSTGPITPPPPRPYSYVPLPAVGKAVPVDRAIPVDMAKTVAVRIHDVLALSRKPKITFDVSFDPSTTLLSSLALTPRVLAEAATTPPLASLTILSTFLPWNLNIRPASQKPGAFVTVADVLRGLYRSLRLPVTPAEFDHIPTVADRQLVSDAYEHRCERMNRKDPVGASEERSKGVKRVDFLMRNHRFLGLSATVKAPDVWRLSVSP
jgi:hypothetical protein